MFSKKKSSLFLNFSTTQFDQSYLVQPKPETKILKSQKISKNCYKIFKKKIFPEKRRKQAILLVFQYQEDAIRSELSSSPCFRIPGGSPEHERAGVAGHNSTMALQSTPFRIHGGSPECDTAGVAGRDLTRALQSTLFQNQGMGPLSMTQQDSTSSF